MRFLQKYFNVLHKTETAGTPWVNACNLIGLNQYLGTVFSVTKYGEINLIERERKTFLILANQKPISQSPQKITDFQSVTVSMS